MNRAEGSAAQGRGQAQVLRGRGGGGGSTHVNIDLVDGLRPLVHGLPCAAQRHQAALSACCRARGPSRRRLSAAAKAGGRRQRGGKAQVGVRTVVLELVPRLRELQVGHREPPGGCSAGDETPETRRT